MSSVPFADLPDDARLWVFAAAAPLSPEQQQTLLARTDDFLDRWHAHGHPVVGARELRHDRFLLVASDERATGVSGCSIDSLFHTLQGLEKELEVSLLDGSLVFYRERNGSVVAMPRGEFRERARTGEVGEDTVVFDNTVRSVADLRQGRWELPMRDAWHARAFPVPAATGGE